MSGLPEKVVDAMTAAMNGEDCSSHGMARAAIAAVAEWLDPKEIPMVLADAPTEIIAAYLRRQLGRPK